jgi:hypothetical protein
MRAGLIPSRALQEKRIIHEHSLKGVDVANLGEILPSIPSFLSLYFCFLPPTKY